MQDKFWHDLQTAIQRLRFRDTAQRLKDHGRSTAQPRSHLGTLQDG